MTVASAGWGAVQSPNTRERNAVAPRGSSSSLSSSSSCKAKRLDVDTDMGNSMRWRMWHAGAAHGHSKRMERHMHLMPVTSASGDRNKLEGLEAGA